jgi:hypothetical protein
MEILAKREIPLRFGFWVLLLCALVVRPASAGSEDSFDYFVNNWNVVGLPDYMYGSRITPDNEMYLAGGTALRVRIGRALTPLSRAQGKRARDGWMPIIEVTAADGSVRYDITYWATPLPDSRDWQKAFNWPTEGENYLNWITIRATNTSATPAEAKADVTPDPAGHPNELAAIQHPRKHTRVYAWTWKLAPGQSVEGVARYTFFPIVNAAQYDDADAGLWLERTVQYWRGVMARAATVQVPCRKASEALLAAHVCQLIASDLGELHGGEGFYDEFYIRDGAYQLMELEEAGLNEVAARAIQFYFPRQRPDGQFESQANELDANGQALWALWQYARITGDRAFLDRAYPRMLNAVAWTMRERRKAPADSPFAGLLPAAPADGEYLWDGKHHIVGYDFWNLRGLLCTADAARRLGRTEDEEQLLAEAREYRAALDAAWKRAGVPYFPPSWEKDGTHWGNTETLWPTALFDPSDPRVAALIDYVRKDFAGGFVEGTIRWTGAADAIHPYLGAYTVMDSLIRGDSETVVEDFYWYLLHSTAANAFAEGIFFKKRLAWSDTIPHVTGACNYAILLRHMLVHEDGEDLHLLSAVPDWWLGDGQEIRLQHLPTYFGTLDLVVRGLAGGVEVSLSAPTRTSPKRILLHLPASRPLTSPVAGVTAVTRPDQKVRWDFPTVVRKYLSSSKPDVTP